MLLEHKVTYFENNLSENNFENLSNFKMENVSPASSKGSKRVKILKNKSFMARLSSALLLNHPKRHAKAECDQQSCHSQGDVDSPIKYKDTVTREPLQTIEKSLGNTSGYATVCDIIQASDLSSDEGPPVPPKRLDDLYSKVNKTKTYLDVGCNTDIIDSVDHKNDNDPSVLNNDETDRQVQITELSQMTTPKKVWNNQTKRCLSRPKSGQEKLSSTIKKVKLFHQGELRHLKNEMETILLRNDSLKKQVKELLVQERKWKEDITIAMTSQQDYLHMMAKNSELNEKISKLEFETKQELLLLCEKMKQIRKENEHLFNEVAVRSEERDLLQQKYDKMMGDKQNMISVQTYMKEIKNYQKSEQELKEKYEKEVKEWQEKYNKIEDEKNSNSVEVHLLKDQKEKLQSENLTLKEYQQELNEGKKQQAEDLVELNQKDREHYELILSMYNLMKDMAAEREILYKKSQFQDGRQKELQAAYISQCHKIGKLECHIATLEEEMSNQAQAIAIKNQETELSYTQMKISYETQLDILRRKILEKELVINNLKEEKKKLKLDFETLWQTVVQEKKISGQKLQRKEVTGEITAKIPSSS